MTQLTPNRFRPLSGRHRNGPRSLNWVPRRRHLALGLLVATLGAVAVGSVSASGAPRHVDPHSAGVLRGAKLTPVAGDLSVTAPGKVSGVHITGSLYISASNVSIYNVQVDGRIVVNLTAAGQPVTPVPSNISLSHVSGRNLVGLGFNGLTLDAVNLANTNGGPHAVLSNYANNGVTYPATNLTIKNSWLHGISATAGNDLGNLSLDGVQGATITNNLFQAVAPNATTQGQTASSVVLESLSYGQFNRDVTFTGNQLYGGGYYQLYFNAAGKSTVADNQFHRGGALFADVQYPPSAYPTTDVPGGGYVKFAQSGNNLDGAQISLPGGTNYSPTSSSAAAQAAGGGAAVATDQTKPGTTSSAPASPTAAPSTTPSITVVGPPPAAKPPAASPSKAAATSAAALAGVGTSSPSSAGVTGTARTTVNGDVSLSASNQTYANKHVTGSLYVTGSNVTVSNVQVDGVLWINETPSGSYVSPVPSNVVFSHVSANGAFSIGFNGLTFDSVNLANAQDAPQAQLFNFQDSRGVMYPASNLVIANSWFHGFLPSTTSAHLENLHLGGVNGATIVNNRFDMTAPDSNTMDHFTANITLETVQYGQFNSNVIIRNNSINGGSYYQLYFDAAGTTNEVSGNQFSTAGNPIFAGIQYPPSVYNSSQLPAGGYVKFTQGGNTLNGQATSLPGGK